MNFFCTEKEFDEYVAEMGLDTSKVIKADLHRAILEAEDIFSVGTAYCPADQGILHLR